MRVAVQKAFSTARAFRRSNQPTKFQKMKFQEKKTARKNFLRQIGVKKCR